MSDEIWNFITTGRDDLAHMIGQAWPEGMAQAPYEPERFDSREVADQHEAVSDELARRENYEYVQPQGLLNEMEM